MNIFKKVYELPLGRQYVRHWGMTEAIREILQNALDSESPFEYELTDDTLKVHSKYTTLTPATLLLGQTTKAEATDKIGSFGEGYKIALLVLARSEYNVRVLNGDRIWTPTFKMSRQFEAEVLVIEDTSCPELPNEGLTFEVRGLSPGDVASIRESCLQMQSHVGECMKTQYGRILRERPGKLYVGGLYVCDTELQFGYDILPQYLKLERDRQTVSNWDLQDRTKEMWFDTERYEEIAQLLADKCKDLDYAEYGAPDMVKEACYRHFKEKHPGAVVARDQDELEKFVKQGMERVVVVGGAYGSAVRGSGSYNSTHVPRRIQTPREVLELWYEANKKSMLRPAKDSFQHLLEKADKWKER